jgi:acyl-homoserine-lactone acylase
MRTQMQALAKKNFLLIIVAACAAFASPQATQSDVVAWERQARNVTIIRDDWGIPHIHGKTDADAVFGMIYAQAEDDFNRVETNYLNSIGCAAETEGESAVYRDLRMKLFIDPVDMKAKYKTSPQWLKKLMNAWADGLNYYLYKNSKVTPKVIKRFEPWMALTFSEGSIGGDIERINLSQLEAFYGHGPVKLSHSLERKNSEELALIDEVSSPAEPTGSNGIAIAPSNTVNRHSILLINPHTSFFFRAELQVASDEGLNAYGAVTWGQLFVYQGFNAHTGWMHTSSGVDAIDEYLETIVEKGSRFYYRYGKEERPLITSKIIVPYKTESRMAKKEFTVYRTQHGPIVRESDGKWVSIRLMQEPVKALMQSYSRTKSKNYKQFRESMELHTNSSNNTIFADADGDIAYFHGNFIPKRDTMFDWTRPVDGSNPATEWKGLLSVDETPKLLNPASGWLYNSNNWPWSAAGPSSPKKEDFPVYVETGGESARGLHAIRVLENTQDFTVNTLITAAYDSYLTAFEKILPSLLKAYDETSSTDQLSAKLSEQIELLRGWDYRWSAASVPTSLAVFWGEEIGRRVGADARKSGVSVDEYIATKATKEQLLQALATACDKLKGDFGSWNTPWGDINRFQRLTGDIVQPFNDAGASIPVGFTSARWGSLASFGARAYRGTKKMYGTSGNSFVAVVEFGDSVRAKAVTAGGESGDPSSPHFNDQATRYSTGNLRDVYFYRGQLEGHITRQYHPGS